jgi:hypothetical protein
MIIYFLIPTSIIEFVQLIQLKYTVDSTVYTTLEYRTSIIEQELTLKQSWSGEKNAFKNIISFDYNQQFVKWSYFNEVERVKYKEKAREMFYHGFDNYMSHAYPLDELDPIACKGRGPDTDNPNNININDVLGNYSLTLIDSMDTLAILGIEQI